MYKKILEIIKQYDKIIISRHHKPDLDALGSQFGLKQLILDNFKNKTVYVVGDMAKPCFLGEMDDISDEEYEDALFIYTDVCADNMIAKVPYYKAKKVITIDHHRNDCNLINAEPFYDRSAAAAAQIIAELAFENDLFVSHKTATCLYAGIISDTNRFNFSLSEKLFITVGKLIQTGFDYTSMYNIMYSDKLTNVKMRAYFMNKFEVEEEIGLAYLKNDESIFDLFKVDFFSISRGMVNVMSNIKEVKVWCNFTQDPETHKIACEFRSKNIIILPIAVKYGGGGHNFACGCTVDSFEIVESILNDFREFLKEN